MNIEHHVQAIGAVLVAEPAADAIETLFNRYAELPGDGERAAFAMALVAELVMGWADTAKLAEPAGALPQAEITALTGTLAKW